MSEIRNDNFISQIIDFTTLKKDGLMPTDIDGCIEYADKLFVFFEFKHKNNTGMPVGQRVFLERLCDRIQSTGVPCFVLQCEHNSNGRIEAGDTICTFYRFCGQWSPPKEPINAKDLLGKLKERYL